MKDFIVRVELHGAGDEPDVYEKLHEAMEDAGFSRKILSVGKVSYKLPTAEYSIYGDYTADTIFELVVTAVSDTGKKFDTLITETKEVHFKFRKG